nr:hypothetical protein CFP56_20470 [Quercus suber]
MLHRICRPCSTLSDLRLPLEQTMIMHDSALFCPTKKKSERTHGPSRDDVHVRIRSRDPCCPKCPSLQLNRIGGAPMTDGASDTPLGMRGFPMRSLASVPSSFTLPSPAVQVSGGRGVDRWLLADAPTRRGCATRRSLRRLRGRRDVSRERTWTASAGHVVCKGCELPAGRLDTLMAVSLHCSFEEQFDSRVEFLTDPSWRRAGRTSHRRSAFLVDDTSTGRGPYHC